MIRRAILFIRENSIEEVAMIAIGKKGRDTLRKRGWSIAGEYLNVSSKVDFSIAKEIAGKIAEMYAAREVDAVYAVYNEFKNVMVQKLRADEAAADRSGRSWTEESAEKAGHGRSAKNLRFPTICPPAANRNWWTTFTKNPSRRFSAASCRAIWKRKSSAFCWNRRRRSTPRA